MANFISLAISKKLAEIWVPMWYGCFKNFITREQAETIPQNFIGNLTKTNKFSFVLNISLEPYKIV